MRGLARLEELELQEGHPLEAEVSAAQGPWRFGSGGPLRRSNTDVSGSTAATKIPLQDLPLDQQVIYLLLTAG